MTLASRFVPGISEFSGLVSEMSEASMRMLGEVVQHRLNRARVLYDSWSAGRVSDCNLRALIPDTWLYVDWPEGG